MYFLIAVGFSLRQSVLAAFLIDFLKKKKKN